MGAFLRCAWDQQTLGWNMTYLVFIHLSIIACKLSQISLTVRDDPQDLQTSGSMTCLIPMIGKKCGPAVFSCTYLQQDSEFDGQPHICLHQVACKTCLFKRSLSMQTHTTNFTWLCESVLSSFAGFGWAHGAGAEIWILCSPRTVHESASHDLYWRARERRSHS